MIIRVPSIRTRLGDYKTLFSLYNKAMMANDSLHVDFTGCNFLGQNAVVVLGAMSRNLTIKGVEVFFRWDTLDPAVRANLAQNGFIEFNGGAQPGWTGNSIPFKHFEDSRFVMPYLKKSWLGRGWVNVSTGLAKLILGRVYEIYDNAFSHSESQDGVFTCGQHFPKQGVLSLCVADTGIGIARKVRNYYLEQENYVDIFEPWVLNDADALELAFRQGFSTRQGQPSGLGLDFLKKFIKLNGGTMQVFSNSGYVVITSKSELYDRQNSPFSGTLVNIDLQCDEIQYCLAGERLGE